MSARDKVVEIGGRAIGQHHEPFIVAEMSGNHNQSLQRALEIVEAAAAAGAHAVKLQTYTAATMTLDLTDGEFLISDPGNQWKGKTLHQLYEQAHTPWEWHRRIFDRCTALGMCCFSTPFDETAVDFLETLAVPCYKIASFENTDLPLIRKVASTGKPLLLSTGMATVAELDEAVRTARDAGCRQLVLLKCTSEYPASPESANLLTLGHMRDLFNCEVGLSDHTPGIGVAVAAVALGASIVEKHFTVRRADGGVDAAFSMEPDEFQALVLETQGAWRAMGGVTYGPTKGEEPSMRHRRSLYVTEDMRAGDVFTARNLRAIRPGNGLPPKYYDVLLGRPVRKDVKRGTPVAWDLLT